MNLTTLDLSYWDLAVATLLVVLAGGISVALRLDLEKRLAVAALRTVVQLTIIGYVLRWVFAISTPWAIMPVMAVMIFVAARAALQRAGRRYAGAQLDAFLILLVSSLFATFAVTEIVVGVTPWYKPQYVIPLLGMVLGNSLTGISLCLDQLLEQFSQKRELVEMELAHGATRWEAARDTLRDALRRGMVPIINSMSVVGLVSLPGMMTGQILAGNPPLIAVKYQIVVMFMIAGATSLGCIGTAVGGYKRLFNAKHQLRAERIEKRG